MVSYSDSATPPNPPSMLPEAGAVSGSASAGVSGSGSRGGSSVRVNLASGAGDGAGSLRLATLDPTQSLDFKYFLSCDISLDVYVGIVRIDGVGPTPSLEEDTTRTLSELTVSARLIAQGANLHAVTRQTSLACRKHPEDLMPDGAAGAASGTADSVRAGSNVSARQLKMVASLIDKESGEDENDYPSGCGVWTFDEWLMLPIKYSELESVAKVAITVRGAGGALVGGAVATLLMTRAAAKRTRRVEARSRAHGGGASAGPPGCVPLNNRAHRLQQ